MKQRDKQDQLSDDDKNMLIVASILRSLKGAGVVEGACFESSDKGESLAAMLIKQGHKVPVGALPQAIEALTEK